MSERAVACIDVTQGNRAMDVTWLDGKSTEVRHTRLAGVDAVVDWASRHTPRVLAVDAPCKRNQQRTVQPEVRERYGFTGSNFMNCRVCEALLRRRNIQIYATPQEHPPAWIATGWKIFERVQNELGYQIWDQPGAVRIADDTPPVLLEVYPHAAFVVGLGARPAKKQTLAGALERIAWLLHAARELELMLSGVWPDASLLDECQANLTALSWETIRNQGVQLTKMPTHDTLDALAGLVTALGCLDGTAWAVGESCEGVIVLPGKPDRQYRPLDAN